MNGRIRRVAWCFLVVFFVGCGGQTTGNGDAGGDASVDAASDTMADAGPDGSTAPSCDDPEVLENDDINGGVTLEAGCYAVNETLTLDEGLLTLKPGVTIQFAQDVGLVVTGEGSLSAEGTDTNGVVLTGSTEQRGYWKGLYFKASDSPDNQLNHVEIACAGSDQWTGNSGARAGIYIRNDGNALAVENSTFRENAHGALSVRSGGVDLTVENTSFEENDAPLWVHPNLMGNLSSLSFSGNDESFIGNTATGAGQGVEEAQTWEDHGVPYRLRSNIFVNAKLTLQPGVTLEFEQDDGLDVGDSGELNAVGGADNPIVFTGVEEQRGGWAGLYFHKTRSDANVLEHATVEYGGGDQWTGGLSEAGLFVRGSGVKLAIRNVTFRENKVTGLLAPDGGSDISVESSSFESNEHPAWVAANHVGSFGANNTFSDNDESDVRVGTGGANTHVEDDQTWAALPVPFRVHVDVTVGAELTVAPGTTVTFEQDTGMLVREGKLIADASEGDRITFTAAEGETLRGYWNGIFLSKSYSSDNIISNADVMYGGGSEWVAGENFGPANIALDHTDQHKARLALDDVKIAGGGSVGLRIGGKSTVTPCSNVTFENNEGVDVKPMGKNNCN